MAEEGSVIRGLLRPGEVMVGRAGEDEGRRWGEAG